MVTLAYIDDFIEYKVHMVLRMIYTKMVANSFMNELDYPLYPVDEKYQPNK